MSAAISISYVELLLEDIIFKCSERHKFIDSVFTAAILL